MVNQDGSFLPSPHFLRVILSEDFARLKLPPKFLERYGNTLSNKACLKAVDSPLTWEVETIRSGQGHVWLLKGWKEFAEYYSIKFGHMLVFEYQGDSKFCVSIFGIDTMEIQYPVEGVRNGHGNGNSRAGEDEDDDGLDDDDDDDDDDYSDTYEPETLPRKHTPSSKGSSRKEIKRTKKNRGPCFRVKMQGNHVKHNRPSLIIPQGHADEYLFGQANSIIYLRTKKDGDVAGGLFECKYHIEASPNPRRHPSPSLLRRASPILRRRLSTTPWRHFVIVNQIKIDDICVFELVRTEAMLYEVTIIRA